MQLSCTNLLPHETFIFTRSSIKKADNSGKKIREKIAKVYLFFREHFGLNAEFNQPNISVEPVGNSLWSCKISGEGKHCTWNLRQDSVRLEEIALAYLRASLPSSNLIGEVGALSRAMPIILGIVFKRSLGEPNWLIGGNDLSQSIDMQSSKSEPATIQGSRVLSHAFYQVVKRSGEKHLMCISQLFWKIFLEGLNGGDFKTFACLTVTFARMNYPEISPAVLQRSWLEVGVLKPIPSQKPTPSH
ncbi:hypothetical protein [Parachlamydia sp. AcF125]|uniref:hypothetical protein n=1 Tax=Parachlamydia sp. AcF125 TaxID=2795736 RepID=UPI001BC92F00|nr:hypothetical protein [Parachlamydia sp. AcF125]MBS4167648.1 hypothetical protein [Parachlamydia sp. AcF125]